MTDSIHHPPEGDPTERLDVALSGIAQVTDEIVAAYQEFDRLVARWSLLEAVTASPQGSART